MQQIRNSMQNKKAYFLQCLRIYKFCLVRPARFELATNWFEASYSNPLSYGRSVTFNYIIHRRYVTDVTAVIR